ncbi:hypothetical protein PHMEG_0002612 [Phytophthora megakarya]|uniref:FHA domain-containing protein n=1 Tax=Phytophthora megakarya TaxID=4795 RepID=A0A225WXV3_9STRA|nr:hypothetical protein PHMEG_0002612 [Phytophthora megakarya]
MPSLAAKVLPWGRFVLHKHENVTPPTQFDLKRSRHCIGRVSNRSDVVIPENFISGVHCIVRLLGKDDRGDPIVEIEDVSRNGVWVNDAKVGNRRKVLVAKGAVIRFTRPQDERQLSYRLEILPSGLTQENEVLHARLSADELTVAGRTRKRTHEEIQSTQSPSKVELPSAQPRPVKKIRQITQSSQEEESQPVPEPDSELTSAGTTEQSGPDSAPQDVQGPPAQAAGKRRHRPDVPASDSELAEFQQQLERLKKFLGEKDFLLSDTKEKLASTEQELQILRQENEALKKTHEDDLATLQRMREENEALKKSREDDLERVKAQVASDHKKEMNELQQDRDRLQRTIQCIVDDPNGPPQVKEVVDLEVAIHDLKHKLQNCKDDLAHQSSHVSHETPPSKKQLIEIERSRQIQTEIAAVMRNQTEKDKRNEQERAQASERIIALVSNNPNLSGSSQSQDSIDSGNLRNNRDNTQLSVGSNENSEPSPCDVALTHDPVDEESKSGESFQGRPPLFDRYGARDGNTTNRTATRSESQVFRGRRRDDSTVNQEGKREPGETEGEETKDSK